ncbi:hypothetical protein [Cognatilysobacter terrigena]|uniref:hypothetical protein n=1 Tax=Cognatilysobacter terrigena TaxID=2488749 RepID=UPI0014152E56|nr:hypothetical protein [Lysobacter terrigena]
MSHRTPPESSPPPKKAESAEHARTRKEQRDRQRNAADRDVESGRNSGRESDDTRQSTI